MEKTTKVVVGLLVFIIVVLGAFCVITTSNNKKDAALTSQLQEQLDAANSDLASTKSDLNKATSQINRVKEAVSDNTTEEKETTASSTTKKNGYKTPYVDFSNGKCLNAASDNNKYSPFVSSSFGNDMSATIDPNGKKVDLRLKCDKMNEYYQVDISKESSDGSGYALYMVDFTKKVANVYIYGWGQGIGNECVIFLMEDGTVEYLKIADALKNKSFKPTILNGVSNVVYVVQGGARYIEPGQDGGAGWITFFGITTTGDYYDLGAMIREN